MAHVQTVNLPVSGKPQYRLGDAVLQRHHRYGQQAFDHVANYPHHFRGTILGEYAQKVDRSSSDPQWYVLSDVVDRAIDRLGVPRPAEDELVIHLRLGNEKGFRHSEEAFVDWIENTIGKNDVPIAEVTIVTAIHFGWSYLVKHRDTDQLSGDIQANRGLVKGILDLLGQRRIKANLYSHADIDQDFCYLASASHLALGSGHFSICAAMVSRGTVLVPPWAHFGSHVDIAALLEERVD